MPALTKPNHELFCREYVKTRKVAHSAAVAGCSPNSAHVTGSRWLKTDKIAQRISELIDEEAKALNIDEEKTGQHLASLAYGSIADFIDFTTDGDVIINPSKATDIQLAAIQSIEVHDYLDGRGEDARDVRSTKLRLHPKLPAIKEVIRNYRFFEKAREEEDERMAKLLGGLVQLATTAPVGGVPQLILEDEHVDAVNGEVNAPADGPHGTVGEG